MPIVNYVREIERFIECASDDGLTANERCLWYGLMHIFNQKASGNEWPGGFIPVPNRRIFALCPGGFDTLARARNRLKQKGYIDFKAGNRNQDIPQYRMIFRCPGGCPENTDKTGFYPQNTDNIQDNTGDNIRDNMRGNTGDNIGDIYPNINRERYTGPKPLFDDDEDDVDEHQRAREAEAVGQIRDGYRQCFGKTPTPMECGRLLRAVRTLHFTADMVIKALEIASGSGAKNPTDYALSVLEDWWNNNVMQIHQVDEYRFMSDVIAGRKGMGQYGTGDPSEDWRKMQEAQRRRIEENDEAGIQQRPSFIAAEG